MTTTIRWKRSFARIGILGLVLRRPRGAESLDPGREHDAIFRKILRIFALCPILGPGCAVVLRFVGPGAPSRTGSLPLDWSARGTLVGLGPAMFLWILQRIDRPDHSPPDDPGMEGHERNVWPRTGSSQTQLTVGARRSITNPGVSIEKDMSIASAGSEDRAMRIDWGQFNRDDQFRHYFRYKLHEKDFRPALDGQGRTLGHFYAKPLYGRLDDRGRVDKSAGFNGEIAIAFAEPEEGHLALLFTQLSKEEIIRSDGRKNWTAIREAARRRICEHLGVAA